MPGDLSTMGNVKYYKGFLNHAYSLQTINAQKNQDLLFRVSDSNKFCFKAYDSSNVSTDLLCISNTGLTVDVPLVANSNVYVNEDLSVGGQTIFKGSTELTGDLTVTGTTNITTTGDTTINGVMTASSTVHITGDLSVASDAVFDNDVTVNGITTIKGTLSVEGEVEFSNTLTVAQNTELSGTLSVDGETFITNSLNVTGNITTDSTVYANDIDVSNNVTVGNKVYVGNETITIQNLSNNAVFSHTSQNGALTSAALYQTQDGDTYIGAPTGQIVSIKSGNLKVYDNSVIVNKPMQIDNTLSVQDATILSSTLSVQGLAYFNNTTEITGELSVGGETTFNNDVVIVDNKTLTVLGTSSVNNLIVNSATIDVLEVDDATLNSVTMVNATVQALSVTGVTYVKKLQVDNEATFNSAVTITGTLSVESEATFNNNVNIDGNISVASNATMFLNNGSSMILKGPSDQYSSGFWADDFRIMENNGNFEMRMVHVDTDTVHYSTNCEFISKSAINFNSINLTLTGHDKIILETETDGVIEVKEKLSVTGVVYLKNDLSVSGVALFNDSVKIGNISEVGATLSHKDHFNSTDYAISQQSDGNVRINAPTTKDIRFMNANENSVLVIEGDKITANKQVLLNDTLSVSGECTFNSDVTIQGDLNLSATSTVISNLNLQGELNVNGTSTFKNSVLFEGLVTSNCKTIHNGLLTVNCAATFESTLSVEGITEINNILSVNSHMIIDGNLSISGFIEAGDLVVKSVGDVAKFGHKDATYLAIAQNSLGNVDISSSTITNMKIADTVIMSIESNCVNFSKNVYISNHLSVSSTLTVDDSAQIGSLDIKTSGTESGIGYTGLDFNSLGFIQDSSGNTKINGENSIIFKINGTNKIVLDNDIVTISTNSTNVTNLTASDSVTVEGSLTVNGDTSLNAGLNLSGALDVGTDATIGGTLSVTDNAYIRGDTFISNSLTVDGDVFLNGNLIVKGTTTEVNIESTNVQFEDNAIVLASNCNSLAQLVADESGLYVFNSAVGFVYKHRTNRGWQTKGSDLGIDKGQKLFFSQEEDVETPKGWSIELDYTTANGASDNSPDMVFNYYDGTSTVTKLRITCDDINVDADDDW